MTASTKIKTPLMTLPMRPYVSIEEAQRLAKAISRLTFADIMEKVTVTECLRKDVRFSSPSMSNIFILLLRRKCQDKSF
jgi:hypothetical protein